MEIRLQAPPFSFVGAPPRQMYVTSSLIRLKMARWNAHRQTHIYPHLHVRLLYA